MLYILVKQCIDNIIQYNVSVNKIVRDNTGKCNKDRKQEKDCAVIVRKEMACE